MARLSFPAHETVLKRKMQASQTIMNVVNKLLYCSLSLFYNTPKRLPPFWQKDVCRLGRWTVQEGPFAQRFAKLASALRSRLGLPAGLELVQNLDGRFWRQVFVKLVVDLDHGSIRASTQAFDFDDGKLVVGRRLAEPDAQMVRDGVDNLVGTATSEHARRRRANLDEMLAYGFAVEHGVKSGDFVHSHGRHFEQFRDVIHDADRAPVLVLVLGNLEQRNDGRLFVLRRVTRDDFFGELLVLGIQFERDLYSMSGCCSVTRIHALHWGCYKTCPDAKTPVNPRVS